MVCTGIYAHSGVIHFAMVLPIVRTPFKVELDEKKAREILAIKSRLPALRPPHLSITCTSINKATQIKGNDIRASWKHVR